MMFGRFTERAQKVLALSQEEAIRLGHNNIGTEHILLGLIREGDGIAAKALRELNLDINKIQEEVEKLIGKGNQPMQSVHDTPRAKKVVELSQDEARKLSHSYVRTEHILLVLIREGEGVAARVLHNLDVNLNKARQQVLQLLGTNEPQSGASNRGRAASNANTATLDSLARDVNKSDDDGTVDPVIGREQEIERIIQNLSSHTENNPELIGEPRVGKTAVNEGLSQQIDENQVPVILRDRRVMS